MTEDVNIHVHGHAGHLSLNRPKALHALTLDMCHAISAALTDWADNEAVQAIILDHAEGRGFCAGGDINLLRNSALNDGGKSGREFFHDEYQLNHQMFEYEKPIVAFMDGITMGGGVGIAMPCKYRVATENTRFAMPETGIGLFPDVGGGWHLSRLGGRLGQFLALTGARLDGAECVWAGIATHYLPAEKLAEAKDEIRLRARAVGAAGTISPQDVVDGCWEVLPHDARITVDAGAHMLPVLHLWRTRDPRGALVSRGLATMGFALPAAIASAIEEPHRTVVAFTGDGGLMMCASELATAAQYGCKLLVVVFNDSCLTLIEAKQRRRRLPNAGVNLSNVNFAAVAEGYGCAGFRVEQPAELRPALAAALADKRTAVVDVVVDPAPYYDQIISLRG